MLLSSSSGLALVALALSWATVWTLGALIQRTNLAWGLLVTELAFIALPAWIVLRAATDLKEPGCFRRSRPSQVLWTVLIAVGALWAAVSRGLAIRQVLGYEPIPPDMKIGSAALMGFGMIILAPLCEELLFRGVLLRSFLKEMSSRNAVLLSAFLFALYHGSLQRLPETFILGLFLGMVFVRSGSYWLAVALHFICNLLGPGLLLLGRETPGLFHPLVVLPVAAAAVYGVYRLGEPAPPEVKGKRAWLAWALFGAPKFSEKPHGVPRTCKLACSGLALAALSVIVWGYVASGQRPRSPNLQRAALSPAELKRWAERSSDALARSKSKEEQVWHLISADRILVKASHIASKPMKGVVRVELPYVKAKMVKAESEEGTLRWKALGNGKYELIPEQPLGQTSVTVLTEKGSTVGATNSGKLLVEYEFPLSALERNQNYRVRLYALRPVQALRLKLVLAEGCGFAFSEEKETREMWLFQGGTPGGPTQLFGTCGFYVRVRED